MRTASRACVIRTTASVGPTETAVASPIGGQGQASDLTIAINGEMAADHDVLVSAAIDQHEVAGAGAPPLTVPVQHTSMGLEVELACGLWDGNVVGNHWRVERLEEIALEDVRARVIDRCERQRLVHGDDVQPAGRRDQMRLRAAKVVRVPVDVPHEVALVELDASVRSRVDDDGVVIADERVGDGVLIARDERRVDRDDAQVGRRRAGDVDLRGRERRYRRLRKGARCRERDAERERDAAYGSHRSS